MDQDLIQKVASLLQVTYSSIANLERIAAEQALAALAKERTSYFQTLLCIISSDMAHHTKNAAGLYLKRFVKDCMESEDLPSEEVLSWGDLIFSQLASQTTDESLRANLGYALLPLLSLENPNSSLLSSLFPLILSGLQADQYVAFGMMKLIQAIYSGYSHSPVLFSYFLMTIPELAGLIYRVLGLDAQAKWELLEEATCTIKFIVEHFSICARSSLIEVQAMPELATLMSDLIKHELNDYNLQETTLVHIGTDIVHVRYNSCKKQVFETINILIEALVSHAQKDDLLCLDSSPLLNMLSFNLALIVRSIELIANRNDKDELMQLEFVSSPVKELIRTLTVLLPLQRFYFFFCQEFKAIAYSICLPLLQVSLNELEQFQDNPEEFANLSSDLCESKESDTYKCAVVDLLLTACKAVDGALSDVWKFSFDLVLGAFENRQEMSENSILNLSNEFRAELGLMTFAVLNPQASARMDLVQYIEEIMRVHLNNFYRAKFLVKARVCLLIKFYSGFIFYNEDSKFAEMVTFLLNCCNQKENDSPAVNSQASDTLSTILQDDEVLIRIFSLLPKVFQYLVELIPNQSDKRFFESIYEMVSTNISVIYPFIDRLVPALVSKIIQVNQPGLGKKSKLLIDLSWNVIQTILDSKKTQEVEASELESFVLPLFEYLKSPKRLYFEDRILQFEVTLMKKCMEISAAAWNIVEILPHLQGKNSNSVSHLFSFINTVIHLGKNEILSHSNHLLTILERCEVCFLSSSSQFELSQACLLYQQVVLAFKSRLSSNFSLLILMVSQKLSETNKKYFNCKLFGLVFCAVADVEVTANCLAGIYQEGFIEFVKVFYHHADCVTSNYDLKLAVLGLCELLKYSRAVEAFKVIVYLLAPQRRGLIEPDKGEFTVKVKTKNLSGFEKEENELAVVVSTMFNDLNAFDEYQGFKELLQALQNANQEDFQRLVQSLDKDQVDDLTEIIKSKRVLVGNGFTTSTEVRKIVKPLVR